LTNKHVIDGCTAIAVFVGNAQKPATLRASDFALDLAVLSITITPPTHPQIRSARDDKLGETVIVAGYPLQGLLGSGLNITTGTVSALTGLGNNSRVLQITAPVQPGNSGGPVLDESGFVAGVVVSKLNAAAVARWTGDIPQNVNFAIKSSVLRGFLEANGIEYAVAGTVKKAPVVDIAERAKAYTSPILCRK
jgi:S1-C subfamily serine protease